jgi:hypothetical protein
MPEEVTISSPLLGTGLATEVNGAATGHVSALIERAGQTFRQELPALLKEHPDEWVAYHGAKRLGFGDTKATLIAQCDAAGLPYEEVYIAFIMPDIPEAEVSWSSV